MLYFEENSEATATTSPRLASPEQCLSLSLSLPPSLSSTPFSLSLFRFRFGELEELKNIFHRF
jgi:hypothetical protein